MNGKTAILVVLCAGVVALMALVATLTPPPSRVTGDHYHTDGLNHEPLVTYYQIIRARNTGPDTNLFQLGDGTVVCIMRVTPKTK